MRWRAVIASIFLIGAGVALTAHASDVTTYGAGLKTCAAYLDAREQQNSDEVPFVDWFSGYASGVNAISLTTNNVLGNSDLTAAIYWIDDYCRANSRARFAEAVDARVAPNHRDR